MGLFKQQEFKMVLRASAFFAVATFSFSSCINNLGSSPTTSGATSSQADVLSKVGTANGSGNGGYQFVITQTVVNARDSRLYDISGDLTGSISRYCNQASTDSTSGSTSSAIACRCVFSYTDYSGTKEVRYPVDYIEDDLARCRRDGLPGSMQSLSVKLENGLTGSYSNTLKLNLGSGSSAVVVDLTNPMNYAETRRIQCREKMSVPYMFAGKDADTTSLPYDPFQSDDPRTSSVYDFFSTSVYQTALLVSLISPAKVTISPAPPSNVKIGEVYGGSWDCVLDGKNGAKSWNNWAIYSQEAYNGSKLISPHSFGRTERNTFFLSRYNSSFFTVPINAYMGPGKDSTAEYGCLSGAADKAAGGGSGSTSSDLCPTQKSLGYGARPLANGSGSGTRCPLPTEMTIPTGYKWVKLWAFAADLGVRKFVAKTKEIQNNQFIACNPGRFEGPDISDPETGTIPYFSTAALSTKVKDYSVPTYPLLTQKPNLAASMPFSADQGDAEARRFGVTTAVDCEMTVRTQTVRSNAGITSVPWATINSCPLYSTSDLPSATTNVRGHGLFSSRNNHFFQSDGCDGVAARVFDVSYGSADAAALKVGACVNPLGATAATPYNGMAFGTGSAYGKTAGADTYSLARFFTRLVSQYGNSCSFTAAASPLNTGINFAWSGVFSGMATAFTCGQTMAFTYVQALLSYFDFALGDGVAANGVTIAGGVQNSTMSGGAAQPAIIGSQDNVYPAVAPTPINGGRNSDPDMPFGFTAGVGVNNPTNVDRAIAQDSPANAIYLPLDQASRLAYTFVTTPESVQLSDMQNQTALGRQFTPYAFKLNTDCTSIDPDTAASGCSVDRKINYNLHVNEITSDINATPGGPQVIYPVCVLQPTDLGSLP